MTHWIRTLGWAAVMPRLRRWRVRSNTLYICRHCGALAAHVESQPAADASAPTCICRPCLGG